MPKGVEFSYNSLIDRAALAFLKNKKLAVGFSHYDVWLYEHAVSFTVAKMMDEDLLADTRDLITAAMENGTGFHQFKKELLPRLAAKGWWGQQLMRDPLTGEVKLVQLGSTRRLRTIFHTNYQTAHAAGRWQRIQNNKKVMPYLKYIASTSENKRLSHMAFYGRILPVDDPFWSKNYPPNGYGCKCSVRQLTAKQALRERQEDIALDVLRAKQDGSDLRFTPAQIENSIKGVLDDAQAAAPIAEHEFINPRTGQKVMVPQSVTPSFAYNPGDLLAVMDALAAQKHGNIFADKVAAAREIYLSSKIITRHLQLVALPQQVKQKEIKRLLIDPLDGVAKPAEAAAAAGWQQAQGVRLERYNLPSKTPPDFMVVQKGVAREDWVTLDFMFTMDADNPYKIQKLNQYLAATAEAWGEQTDNIQEHLAKADIVPLDLRHLNTLNRAKIINYVLSLPEEQQQKIRLLVKESQ